MKITVDIEDLWPDDECQSAVADIIRDEVEKAIRREVRGSFDHDPKVKELVHRARNHYIDKILAKLQEGPDLNLGGE